VLLVWQLVIQEENTKQQNIKHCSKHSNLQQITYITLKAIEHESILQTSSGSVFHKLFAEVKKLWNKVVWAKIWESVAEFIDIILDRYGVAIYDAGC